MVDAMNRSSSLLVMGSFLLLACKDDGPSFISLSTFCERHAEDICNARQACCEGADEVAGCRSVEQTACEGQRDQFVEDESLTFDSREASRVLREQEERLRDCADPFAVGRYFRGTQAAGKSCDRDSQCESNACDAEQGVCLASDALMLCSAAD